MEYKIAAAINVNIRYCLRGVERERGLDDYRLVDAGWWNPHFGFLRKEKIVGQRETTQRKKVEEDNKSWYRTWTNWTG